MKKLYLIVAIILGVNIIQSQTMFVRPLVGNQTSYLVANIQKLTFVNGNLIVVNETGPNDTFSLADNRYINFIDLTLGINNPLFIESKFYVYPNPCNQWLNIGNTNPNHTPSLVEIIAIDGKLLMEHKPLTVDLQIDISTLPQGIYLCRISSEYQKQIVKFLKK